MKLSNKVFHQVIFDTVVTYFEMKFENQGYQNMKAQQTARKDASMPIKASIMFEMFPFCILYNVIIILILSPFINTSISVQSNMEVTCLGSALRQIIPRIVGNV